MDEETGLGVSSSLSEVAEKDLSPNLSDFPTSMLQAPEPCCVPEVPFAVGKALAWRSLDFGPRWRL